MLLRKTSLLNDIVGEVLKRIVQTTLVNILINRLLPYANILFNVISTTSYYLIFIYLLSAVAILFVLYKFFRNLTYKKNKKSLSSKITSITSRTDDFDLNPKKMEKLKNKSDSKSKKSLNKNLTTDLIST